MTTKEVYLQFMAGLTGVEKILISEIVDIIGQLPTDKDGNLVNRRKTRALIARINEVIEGALKDSGYFELTNELFDNFTIIEDNLISTHLEVNSIKVAKNLITPTKKYFVEQAKDRLIQGGIRSEFAIPIEQTMFSFIRNNDSVIKLERSIRAVMKNNLKRWAGEAARDAVFGYQGSMHDAVKAEYNFNGFIYVGSIRDNTRTQCRKWLTEIKKADDATWSKEIAWAKRGGTYNKKRVSGFNKATNIDNFSTYRGGFNCLHEAIPTNV